MPKVSQASHAPHAPHTFHRSRAHSLHAANYKQKVATFAFAIILILVASTCLCAIVCHVANNVWNSQFNQQGADGPYSLVGKPSISADFINKVLAYYRSPAQGKGQALYNDGLQYNIDPAYALAFFMHESSFGEAGIATITHSLGNIRASTGYAQYSGYRFYQSWEEGFVDWYKLIAQQYVKEWNLYTVDQIIPVYAPASDANDEDLYIHEIKYAIDRWHTGKIEIDF